jgi:calcium-dependent protein kinase
MELLDTAMEQEKISVDMSTLNPEDIERFKALFTSVDVDQSGSISNDELQGLFKSLEITATPEEIEKLIRTVDIDHSGNLSFDEFVTMICLMAANEEEEKEQHRENLRVVFDSVGKLYILLLTHSLCPPAW